MSSPQVTITGFADEIAGDSAEQLAGLESAGVSHLELRAINGSNVLDLTDEQVHGFRQQLKQAGVAVSCIGSPIGKVQIRSDLEQHFARFQVALHRAAQFDCSFVRLFSFYHEDEEPAAVRDLVLTQLQRMTEAAAQARITLLHENERDIYGDTPERCLDLISSIDSPHLRVAFDPANFVQCGASSAAGWKLLADHVVYFHIKDAIAASGRVVPAGFGDGDLEAILGAAVESGYTGFLSIEPHLAAEDPDYGGNGSERFIRATTALRDILHRLGASETTR